MNRIVLGLFGILLLLLAVVNPSKQDFLEELDASLGARVERTRGWGYVAKKAISIGFSRWARTSVVRRNYLFFSVFEVPAPFNLTAPLVVVGVGGFYFVPLED